MYVMLLCMNNLNIKIALSWLITVYSSLAFIITIKTHPVCLDGMSKFSNDSDININLLQIEIRPVY